LDFVVERRGPCGPRFFFGLFVWFFGAAEAAPFQSVDRAGLDHRSPKARDRWHPSFVVGRRWGACKIVVSHSKRKERVLNGAQFIGGEPRVRRLDRAACLSQVPESEGPGAPILCGWPKMGRLQDRGLPLKTQRARFEWGTVHRGENREWDGLTGPPACPRSPKARDLGHPSFVVGRRWGTCKIVVSHSKRKERVLNGAQFIGGRTESETA